MKIHRYSFTMLYLVDDYDKCGKPKNKTSPNISPQMDGVNHRQKVALILVYNYSISTVVFECIPKVPWENPSFRDDVSIQTSIWEIFPTSHV